MKSLKTVFILGIALILISPNARGENMEVENQIKQEIDQWGMIDEGIYRGAQPTERGIELLKELGIKTVINFRHETEEIEKEKKWVESQGMKFVSLPWRIQTQPESVVMKKYLELLKNKSDGPFFVHCRRGAERTGTAEALYLYYNKGFNESDAYEKSIKDYHTLFYWRPFIKKRIKGFIEDIGPREVLSQS